MVTAIINISEQSNRILNIVKAKYGLKDKSEAINVIAEGFGNRLLEPQLRPEYIARAKKISGQKPIAVGTVAQLGKRHEKACTRYSSGRH